MERRRTLAMEAMEAMDTSVAAPDISPVARPTLARQFVLAPVRLGQAAYHLAVPARQRIIFWTWRRRNSFHLRMLREALKRAHVRRLQGRLRSILAQHPEAKGVVIFPPSVPWFTELFQRPQQMALAFAALGYVVLYWVEQIDTQDDDGHFRNVAERVYLCDTPPTVFWVCERPIFVSYTYNYNWATWLRSPTIVYELIDHLDIFSNFPRRMLERFHRRLLRRARLVVGTADDLLAELAPHRPDAILAPNGVDLAHFARYAGRTLTPTEAPDDLRALVARGAPIIGYYGALAAWFDFTLLNAAADALPAYEFVLIGPDYDGQTIRRSGIDARPNIHWLGAKSYAELPRYLACFDVATIPFMVSGALNAVSPIKLFEYMAGGRPIVTTDLAECRKYDVALIARSAPEWIARLQEAVRLRRDDAYLARLRRAAEANTWAMRAQTELDALARLAPMTLA